MKIAVTSLGESLESPVDQRFGRARFFVLYNLETSEWIVRDNKEYSKGVQDAGFEAAQMVVEMGAEAVITGHCGPQAFVSLSTKDVAIYEKVSGSVQDVIDSYRAGLLKQSDQSHAEESYESV